MGGGVQNIPIMADRGHDLLTIQRLPDRLEKHEVRCIISTMITIDCLLPVVTMVMPP